VSARSDRVIFTLGLLAGEIAGCSELELEELGKWAASSLDSPFREIAIAALAAEHVRRGRPQASGPEELGP